MPYSTCCGAETKNTEQDICPICRYYCDWEEIPSEEPSDEETENQIEETQINKHLN
jgi:hypothetical protein